MSNHITKVGLIGRLIHSLFYKLSYSFASILFELSKQLTYGHSPTMTRQKQKEEQLLLIFTYI